MNKETLNAKYLARINLLTARDPERNRGIINKLKRKLKGTEMEVLQMQILKWLNKMHDVYFFTDVHGQLRLYNYLKDFCFSSDPETTIIYGGDACDRGEHGYEIMKDLLDNPRIIYLQGNHEQLFCKAARAILGKYPEAVNKTIEIDQIPEYDVLLHLYNGGEPTLKAWINDGAPREIIDELSSLPYICSYENMDFSHACIPFPSFQELQNAHLDAFSIQDCLWSRDFFMGWPSKRINIHGHTPTPLLPEKIYGPNKDDSFSHPCYWKGVQADPDYRGWRLDMDTGMTFVGRAYVLNCTTNTITGFSDPQVLKPKTPAPITQIEQYKLKLE